MPDDFSNPWDEGGKNYPSYLSQGQTRWLPTKEDSPDSSGRTVYLKNNSRHTVYYKSENTGEALPVSAGGTSYEPLDGLATHRYCNQVYKVRAGATVTVDENGNVDPDLYGIGDFQPLYGGGWKGTDWLRERLNQKDKDGNPKPDTGWTALFRRAINICRP